MTRPQYTSPFRRFFNVFLFCLTAATLAACGTMMDRPYGGESATAEPTITQTTPAGPPAPAITGPVRVALLVPLSGTRASIGKSMLNAAQMALFDIGGANFELMPIDTGGTADGARKAAQMAAQQNRAQLILGPIFAEEVRAAKPAAAASGTPMIVFSTDWNLADGNTFVMGFLPFDQVRRIAGFAAAQGLSPTASVIPDTEYGRAVGGAWSSAAQNAGLSTAPPIMVRADGSGFTGITAPVSAVFMPLGGGAASSVAGQLPPGVRKLGTGLMDDPALARNPALNGAWFAAPAPRARRDFEKRFQQTYGYAPPRIASLGYDATALSAALARTGSFGASAIANPNGFAGIDGIFRFSSGGLVERGLAVLEYRNGAIIQIDDAPKSFEAGVATP